MDQEIIIDAIKHNTAQQSRIADAMEATNKRDVLAEKRRAKLESLQVIDIRKKNNSKSDKE